MFIGTYYKYFFASQKAYAQKWIHTEVRVFCGFPKAFSQESEPRAPGHWSDFPRYGLHPTRRGSDVAMEEELRRLVSLPGGSGAVGAAVTGGRLW